MKSGYLDTKYTNINEDIIFMSWNMLLCCMIIPPGYIVCWLCQIKMVKQNFKIFTKNVKQWLFINDMLLAKIFSGSFFIYHSISSFQKNIYTSMKKDSFSLYEIICSKQNTTCLLFIEHTFKLYIVLQFNGRYAVKCAYRWCKK